ncbi:rare lipoprotein A [Lewinella marina]|nr:septal ring lytic transglycosylase RlpA family protein [Neolewinella marina]NJB86923.1 rare lipoprotein A [Neolewinella marina]
MSLTRHALRHAIFFLLLLLVTWPLAAQPQEGIASYYADRFHDRPTSTGEAYDKDDFTAASKAYPYGTVLEVTNVSSGRSVEVRVNDCGPHHPERIVDLSRAAARKIGLLRAGTAQVEVRVVSLGDQGPTCDRSGWVPDSPAVALDTVPAPAATTATKKEERQKRREFAADEMLFGVQVGAFSQEENARALVDSLHEKGFADAWTARVGKVHRVFTGRYYFQDEARGLRDRVREAGYREATVRRVQ